MDRMSKAMMAALVLVGAVASRAEAAPPTVTPSPGYDARLQEQRAAAATSGPVVVAPVRPAYRHRHAKPGHHYR